MTRTAPKTLPPNQEKQKKKVSSLFFIKWKAPQGVLHLPCSENVPLHVLNRRPIPGPPRAAVFDTTHPELVFASPMMRMIRALWQARGVWKNRLNYPLLRGCVSSRCVVFITAMFTFISTCRKRVTISSAPRSHAPAAPDIRFRLWTANRCYRAHKMFCLPSISEKAQGPGQDFTCQSAQEVL